MPEQQSPPNRYVIKKLHDLLQLTPEQLDDCLVDIKSWHALFHPLYVEMEANDLALEEHLKQQFTWVDDKQHDGKITIDLPGSKKDSP